MINLPNNLREQLIGKFGNEYLSLSVGEMSEGPQVKKLTFTISGGNRIESVLMKFNQGHQSLCISSQAGCALACNFCATGAIGFKRNLTVDEITDQVLYFRLQGEPVDNITFMGMGEPLLNPGIFNVCFPKMFLHPHILICLLSSVRHWIY